MKYAQDWLDFNKLYDESHQSVYYGVASGTIFELPTIRKVKYFNNKSNEEVISDVANFKIKSYKVSKRLAFGIKMHETVEWTDNHNYTYFDIIVWGKASKYLLDMNLQLNQKIAVYGKLTLQPKTINNRTYPNFHLHVKTMRRLNE